MSAVTHAYPITRQILLISLFALGLRMLNMMPGRREFTLFVGLWIGFGLAGGACAVVFAGPGMSGPGMGFSIAFGVIAYLFVSTRFRPVQTKRDIMAPYQVVLVVSLMSAIFGHLIELQTGILIVTTHLMFWLYAAILASCRVNKQTPLNAPGEDFRRSIGEPAPDGAGRAWRVIGYAWVR